MPQKHFFGLRLYILLIRSNKDQVWKYSWRSTLKLASDTSKLSGSSSFPLHTGSSITSVIECGQNAKEKSNNWKTLLIAGILRDFFLRICAMSNIIQPLGQVNVHGAFRGPGIACLVLQDVTFGHWAKAITSF
jgi:hypothetical protein